MIPYKYATSFIASVGKMLTNVLCIEIQYRAIVSFLYSSCFEQGRASKGPVVYLKRGGTTNRARAMCILRRREALRFFYLVASLSQSQDRTKTRCSVVRQMNESINQSRPFPLNILYDVAHPVSCPSLRSKDDKKNVFFPVWHQSNSPTSNPCCEACFRSDDQIHTGTPGRHPEFRKREH